MGRPSSIRPHADACAELTDLLSDNSPIVTDYEIPGMMEDDIAQVRVLRALGAIADQYERERFVYEVEELSKQMRES